MFEDKDTVPCDKCGRVGVRAAVPDPLAIAQLATKGLLEDVVESRPDVVFFISAFYQSGRQLKLLRDLGLKIVMLHTESPYQDDEQMLRGRYADLNLLNDPVNLAAWKATGPALYVPHSYDPDVHYPVYPRSYSADFTFVGTAFRSRCEFFSAMDFSGIATVLGGNGWDTVDPEFTSLLNYLGHQPGECVDNAETARVYRMSRTGINFYRRESEDAHKGEGVAIGPREVEMAACGLFFLRDPRPESDDVFPMLPTFDGPADAEEQLRWWLDHTRLREDSADRALMAVQDRTFDNRATEVCAMMEKEGIL